MTTPLINVDLAERVLGHIIAYPETHKQASWHCDSGQCFAGWAVELSGGKWLQGDDALERASATLPDGRYGHARELAMQLLNVDEIDAHILFAGHNTISELQTGVKILAGGDHLDRGPSGITIVPAVAD